MKREQEVRSLLFLRLLPGVGDRRLARALENHGTARTVLGLPERRLAEVLGRRGADALQGGQGWTTVDDILDQCREMGIRIVGRGDERYPAVLLPLADPPAVLFLRGSLELLDRPAIAIVGSRRATATGRRTAERLGRELSAAGVTVVSGMALGIDGAAHRGALEGRGGTVAVLGSGPDRSYPKANSGLFNEILERGLIVSEFPPGEPARPFHFPRRNRILAALSAGVVVVQAARRSGALITVEHALDLGREVFAVPGSVERRQSEGVNALLRDGAHVLVRARELLEVMGWGAGRGEWDPSPTASASRTSPATEPSRPTGASGSVKAGPPGTDEVGCPATSDRFKVCSILEPTPRPVAALVGELGIPAQRVLAALTRLELDGVACREGGGWTCRDRC
ncbi:MAG: DNA-processing protein DprA [Gemmatimonadota bacterium]